MARRSARLHVSGCHPHPPKLHTPNITWITSELQLSLVLMRSSVCGCLPHISTRHDTQRATQVIGELRGTSFRTRVRSTILASRAQTCLNPQVAAAGQGANAACRVAVKAQKCSWCVCRMCLALCLEQLGLPHALLAVFGRGASTTCTCLLCLELLGLPCAALTVFGPGASTTCDWLCVWNYWDKLPWLHTRAN